MPLDPITVGVISGVLVNALTPMLAQIAHAGLGKVDRVVGISEWLDEFRGPDKELNKSIKAAVRSAAKGNKLVGIDLTDQQTEFLKTPELAELVAQIYATHIGNSANPNTIGHLRRELERMLLVHGVCEEAQVTSFGAPLFDILWQSCEDALTAAIDKGVLSAHEAKDISRHRVVLDRLANIEKSLELFSHDKAISLSEVLEFEREYRSQVADRHKTIVPPQYDANRKVPFDSIYVQQRFHLDGAESDNTPWSGEELASVFHRCVVLGQPGGGKSTFAQKICFELAEKYGEDPFGGRNVTPILVVLREFGAAKKENDLSILEFIETKARTTYQNPAPPAGAFHYLLTTGRALVIFDGLDELLDTSYRQEVTDDVEAFCNLYPSASVLITSRERGYEQAPLSEDRFLVFRLAELEEPQIKEYVTNLFRLEDGGNDLSERVKVFLEEAEMAADLFRNPLMLGLITNLYRGEGFIPRNRPEVLQKCAEWLFVKWDKKRRINVSLPFEDHLRPAIAHLAQWIYSSDRLPSGVTADQLIDASVSYLHPRRYDDPEAARGAATDFVEFVTGRAWVLADTGTTSSGDRIFEFTHRTFLEYFTALYLVRNNPSPQKLRKLLIPKIVKEEWDVVAQLAYQMLGQQQEGGADALLHGLILELNDRDRSDCWNILSFASRALQFLVPSPKIRREIAGLLIKRYLVECQKVWAESGPKIMDDVENVGPNGDRVREFALANLLQCDAENRAVVDEVIEEVLTKAMRGRSLATKAAAVDIFGMLHYRHIRVPHQRKTPTREEQWHARYATVMRESVQSLRQTFERYPTVGKMGLRLRLFPMSEFLRCHGPDALLHETGYVSAQNVYTLGILDSCLRGMAFQYENSDLVDDSTTAADLSAIGGYLCDTDPPWFNFHRNIGGAGFRRFPGRNFRGEVPRSVVGDPSAIFGCFVAVALIAEGVGEISKFHDSLPEDIWYWAYFGEAIQARFGSESPTKADEELGRSEMTQRQLTLASKWCRREVNFISARKGNRRRKPK